MTILSNGITINEFAIMSPVPESNVVASFNMAQYSDRNRNIYVTIVSWKWF